MSSESNIGRVSGRKRERLKVWNGVGAGIGTLVGKECKGAFNRSVPTAKYKAGECTCSYEWCGKAGKIRIVCVPARTKDK